MTSAYISLPPLSVLDASRVLHPFTKVRALLDDYAPGKEPVALTIGEPQNQPPAFILQKIAEAGHSFNRYPPPLGDRPLLEAQAAWLARRYDLRGLQLAPEQHILASAGSREGVTMCLRAAVEAARIRGIAQPKILLPNPFYHAYVGACLSAGGQAVLVAATAATGFLPDFQTVPDDIWDQAAAVLLCSPANPQGAVASGTYLTQLVARARKHGTWTIFDDCYADIYRDTPPDGILNHTHGQAAGLEGVVVLHSLSKRSSAAGLRVGFITGDPKLLGPIAALLKFTGASIPMPLQAAGIALLEDEAHVAANRARYNAAFEAARTAFPHVPTPQGGFFLWLPVGDAEQACVKLWRDEGIRTLPGSAVAYGEGEDNPGSQYLRLALVIEPHLLPSVLERAAVCLDGEGG